MKAFTYWETIPEKIIPPYITLGIVSMKLVFGDNFLLLTKKNISKYLNEDALIKNWKFTNNHSNISSDVAQVVAKSDYIRMAYIYENGGFWLDSDTIIFKNLLSKLDFSDGKLLWHSEQLFGATIGNNILGEAAENMLKSEFQTWGNPGGIKGLILNNTVKEIPFNIINPGVSPVYSYNNCEMIFDTALPVSDFLINNNLCALKLYNTGFTNNKICKQSISEFLDAGSLLSKIFLSINKDKSFWIKEGNIVLSEIS